MSCLLPSPSQLSPKPATAMHWAPGINREHELVAVAYDDMVTLLKLSPAAVAAEDGVGVKQQQQGLQLAAEIEVSLAHAGSVWKLEFDQQGTKLACSLAERPEIWVWALDMMGGKWDKAMTLVGGSAEGQGDGGDASGFATPDAGRGGWGAGGMSPMQGVHGSALAGAEPLDYDLD